MRSTVRRATGFVLLLASLVFLAQPAIAAGKHLKPGEHIKECSNCPELIVLPAGTYCFRFKAFTSETTRERRTCSSRVRRWIGLPNEARASR